MSFLEVILSLEFSVLAIQFFATLFMGLEYFRNTNGFLQKCEKNLRSEFNKTKISIVKEKEHYNKNKKISIEHTYILFILWSILLIYILSFHSLTSIDYICRVISLAILFIIVSLYTLFKSIPLLSIKLHEFLFKMLNSVSGKGHMAGLGFIFIISSFIFDGFVKFGNQQSMIYQYIEIFSLFYIVIGVSTLGIILKSYYK